MAEQYSRNQELLMQTPLGGLVLDAYDAAIDMDPRLVDSLIVAIPGYDMDLTYAMAKWDLNNFTGEHLVATRLDEPYSVFDIYRQAIEEYPLQFDIMCQRAGIKPEDATPHMMYTFGVLHELGHVSTFHDFDKNPDTLLRQIRREELTIPYGHLASEEILTQGTEAHAWVSANLAQIRSDYGVGSPEELVELQGLTYRNMPNEANADHFAGDTLTAHPELMDLLLDPKFKDYLMLGTMNR